MFSIKLCILFAQQKRTDRQTGGKTLCQTAVQRQDTIKWYFAVFVYIAQKTGKKHEKWENAMINF